MRKNPFDFQLNTVIDDDTVPKTVLTLEQEERLLDFAKSDTVYHKNYDEILLLLKTGLCISELCGLTASNLDFENHLISVDHQLLRSTMAITSKHQKPKAVSDKYRWLKLPVRH